MYSNKESKKEKNKDNPDNNDEKETKLNTVGVKNNMLSSSQLAPSDKSHTEKFQLP